MADEQRGGADEGLAAAVDQEGNACRGATSSLTNQCGIKAMCEPLSMLVDRHRASAVLMAPFVLVDPNNSCWPTFAASWNDLPHDIWMADDGSYRRRRYAAFDVGGSTCKRLPYRPHYQDRDHNPLNGGVERWFAPMKDELAESLLFHDLVLATAASIERLAAAGPQQWEVEAHQFRIETHSGQPGLPTPEGMHRDGRDWVLILFMDGGNFAGGDTRIEDRSGKVLMRHRLSASGEALLLDDRAVRHGTSAIKPIASSSPAWRDTLVLTFAAAPSR